MFDFDGTLVQSEDTHRQTFSKVLNVELTEEYWNSECVGHSPRSLVERLLPDGRLEELGVADIDGVLAKRSELFEEHIAAGLLEATGGAAALLSELSARGVRCAVVSSGSRSYIDKALETLGIASAFELIVAGDDPEVVSSGRHKPDPFPYTHAAGRLQLPVEACLAFEDSLAGIRSAQAAGMSVVAIRNVLTDGLAVVGGAAAAPSPGGLEPVAALVADFDEMPRTLLD